MKRGIVSGVLSAGYVNVDTSGTTIPNVRYPSWYAPQTGDLVVIEIADGLPFVVTCLTQGRSLTGSVSVVNSAPGAGWDQISTVYSQTGVNTNPALTLVRTTAPSSPTTLVANPVGSRTWSPDWPTWRTDTDNVRQGDYGSGENYGLYFYGSGAFSSLTGHTVTGITMTVTRASSGGTSYGAMQLDLYLHGYATQPGSGPPTVTSGPLQSSGAAPSLGATVTFSLPLSWGQALQAGTSAGVGIASPNASDYVILNGASSGSGQLSITYT